ncbi:Polygalacturonase [Bertholletia excelsa]
MASSSSSPCSVSTYTAICLIHLSFIISNFTHVRGIDYLIRLPSSGDSRNTPRSNSDFYVEDYGAKGDGSHDDTKAFKNVWKVACSFSSQSRKVIHVRNTYLVRPINFGGPCRSKLILRISGTIVAPESPDAWDGLDPHKWLYFHNVNHLTINGRGTINGMGWEWWAQSCKINKTNPCRHAPTALTFHKCKNLNVRNFWIVNSQQMHLAFTNSVRIAASHLKVTAPASSPNTDGIHISSSSRVHVKNSIIKTGDDCISIVGNSSRIQIKNISCGPGHGVSIGSLGKSNSLVKVHDVSVNGAFLSNTNNGARIKTWQGGTGFAANIEFRNLWMENVSNPIIIDQYYCDSPIPCQNQSLAVKVSNISFTNIRGTSATEEAMIFACSDASPCEGLYLEDIILVSSRGTSTRSFCWEAEGSASGSVYPPPCFSCDETFIKQRFSLNSVLHSI